MLKQKILPFRAAYKPENPKFFGTMTKKNALVLHLCSIHYLNIKLE